MKLETASISAPNAKPVVFSTVALMMDAEPVLLNDLFNPNLPRMVATGTA
jgi:hypothetical protein